LAITACKADDPPVRGQLMVILQTDMSLPKDVTQVKILVKRGGTPYHDKNYIIAPGEDWVTKLPATLAVVASVEDPTPRVEVTVVGLRRAEARVFAQAVTTIPERRTATLFVPIQWLCEGQVRELPRDAGYVSSCEPKGNDVYACRAGTCENVTVDEEDLDDYDPSDVFGGADDPKNGLCFETVECFASGFRVVPNEDCIVEVGVPEGYELNLALLNPSNGDGICDRDETSCYIPLDRDARFGWTYAKGTSSSSMPIEAQLPKAVCTKLAAGDIQEVQATLACASKTKRFPTCGPWSSVDDGIDVGEGVEGPVNAGDGGTDAGTGPSLPDGAELIIDFANAGEVIEIGVPVQLQLTVVLSDGEEQDVTDQAVWSVENEEIAEVVQGTVTGKRAGPTRIAAELGGVVAHFEIDVERGTPESIEVLSPSDSVPAGLTVQLVATITYQGGYTEDNPTDVLTWGTSDEAVATISQTGEVTGVTEGTALITAELNGVTSAAFELEVGPAILQSIALGTMQIGANEYQVTATGTYSDASQRDITEDVTWEQVDGEAYGTVDETGRLTVISLGPVTVRASLDGVSKRVTINVTNGGGDGDAG
jgi:hypothetical protein